MITTCDIVVGQVVKSKAGRDKNRFFVVLEVLDDKYLHLIDGDLRKIHSPKRKKVKHIAPTSKVVNLNPKSKTVNDSYIRKELAHLTGTVGGK